MKFSMKSITLSKNRKKFMQVFGSLYVHFLVWRKGRSAYRLRKVMGFAAYTNYMSRRYKCGGHIR